MIRKLLAWMMTVTISVVTLTWDHNTEADLGGYNIYCDGQLVGTVPKLINTFTHYLGGNLYFIRAFNTSGQESANSNAVVVGSVTIY